MATETNTAHTPQPTLPVRNKDIPARDLDPDFNPDVARAAHSGTVPVDQGHAYAAGGNAAGDKLGDAADTAESAARDAGQQLKSGATDLKNQAQDAGNRVADQAKQAYADVQDFTHDALDKAKGQWDQTSGKATDRARQFADTQKGKLAGGLDDAALAARKVVESLHERDDHGVAQYAESIAGGLETARDYLHNADVSEMLDGAKRFTRRHPEWVVGGLFVAGLAAARFLKADRPGQSGFGSRLASSLTGGKTLRHRDTHPGDDTLFDDLTHAQHGDYPHAFDEISRQGGERNPSSGAAANGGTVGLDNPAGHTQNGGLAVDDYAGDDVGGMGVTDTRNAAPTEVGAATTGDTMEKGSAL